MTKTYLKGKHYMKQNDKIALIGLSIIAVSAMNFLDNPWTWLGTIEFMFVCFGVSYLVRKKQDENSRKKMRE